MGLALAKGWKRSGRGGDLSLKAREKRTELRAQVKKEAQEIFEENLTHASAESDWNGGAQRPRRLGFADEPNHPKKRENRFRG